MYPHSPKLDPNLCRTRQAALLNLLSEQKLGAALLTNRNYIHALTGYWHEQSLTEVAVLVSREGAIILFAPGQNLGAPAIENHISYEPQELCTLVENIPGRLADAIRPSIQSFDRIGVSGELLPGLVDAADWIDITSEYQLLRRCKEADEIEMLRFAIRATEATYEEARRILKPGLRELTLFGAMHAAAVEALGEPLSGWGNDFRSGEPGGFPRTRAAEAGEIAILDIGVGYRGYRSDLCRSFAVDGQPTDAQQKAHTRLTDMHTRLELYLRPGLSCKTLFEEFHAQLEGWNAYSFFHHLGHGIGLDAHEYPHINPHWDDTLQAGDVVAVEPGLYGEELKAGIRLEQNYLITESGCERLSQYPLDL
ncbi:MAG: Xaa-Pro peptidase family protein [Opitutaceae bacterium]|nr:Xaa-Pro peptidase family protein [Opitutaceae bacterium]